MAGMNVYVILDGGLLQVLWAKGTQYCADLHLWLSVFSRPSYSRFTRAQRLTCCLSLLLSYTAVNAAWYQYNEKEVNSDLGLSFYLAVMRNLLNGLSQ